MSIEWLLFVALIVSGLVVVAIGFFAFRMVGVAVHDATESANEVTRYRDDRERDLADLLSQFAFQLCVPTDEQTDLAKTIEGEESGSRRKHYRPPHKPDFGDRPMSGTESSID